MKDSDTRTEQRPEGKAHPAGGGRTGKLAALFLSAALTVGTVGCSNSRDCMDENRDGYCDNSSGSHSSYYYGGSGGSSKSGTVGSGSSDSVGSSNGVTSGSRGGLGSSSKSSSS
ncbi:hypothetical protein MJA45_26590 [Paenibacillus aurantius]|uniref:Uncharacterized protein n=1 Tax=Paenibacillus aurantius TaxID=2918900 RepID=A0AA96RD31_9BACL|nr:hypothetical protein [Paenibacillus aurantius]WNQ11125.1 hypothetical protein MJA45_26590 [Paenibacillus aurantius]